MSTQNWSTVLDQSSDAAFRAHGSELNAKLVLVGCVQQADTGQINWTTVTRAGISASAGYEIWKTPAGNVTFKLEYGSGNATTVPAHWLTFGTGSNGSGTLTGQLSTRTLLGTVNTAIASTITNYPSYLCAVGDYVGLCWKVNSPFPQCPRTGFILAPKVDASGAALTTAFYALTAPTNSAWLMQCVRTAAPAATGNQTVSYCLFVGKPAASSDGLGNNQTYLHWLNTPDVNPSIYSATVIASELTFGTTIPATLVGTTPRTYINPCSSSTYSFDSTNTTSPVMGLLMLWE